MACIQTGGIYALINAKGETCMDVSGGDNVSVIGYGFHNGPNQAWLFESTGQDRTFTIKSVGVNKYLAPGGDLRNEQKVIADPAPFPWRVEDAPGVENGVRITPVDNGGLSVDLSNYGDPTPGTPVQLWGSWDAPNQVWRLRKN